MSAQQLLTRRRALQLMLAGFASSGFALSGTARASSTPVLLSARDDPNGQHWAVGFSLDGSQLFATATTQRCHDILPHPSSKAALFIARRPGTECYWIDLHDGQILSKLSARPQRHFYGHGVFDPLGKQLFLTENDLTEPGRGVIGIYQLENQHFEFVREISSHGIEPHQLEWLPDHSALVTANGGMRTEAGSRTVLNPEQIESSLVIVSPDGKLLSKDQLESSSPAKPFTSIRHLAVQTNGSILTAQQVFLPESLADTEMDIPLLAMKLPKTALRPIAIPKDQLNFLNNYLASIALHPSQPWMAITAPRGNRVLVWQTQPTRFLASLEIGDCAGIVACEDGFVVSSGQGRCRLVQVRNGGVSMKNLTLPAGGWDNHLRLTA